MSQGHYPIRTDDKGTRRLAPSPRAFELFGADGAQKQLMGRTLSEARTRVEKAWNAR